MGQRRLSTERRDVLRATLLLRAVHLHERQRLGGLHGLSVSQRSSSVLPPLSIIRSLADIGRKYSAREVDRGVPTCLHFPPPDTQLLSSISARPSRPVPSAGPGH